MTRAVIVAVLVTIAFSVAAALPEKPVGDRWQFKFHKVNIGAWWGPTATDAEMKSNRDARFNVVMARRYMQLDSYGSADMALRELYLAGKYRLGVMFDAQGTFEKRAKDKEAEFPPILFYASRHTPR